MKWYITFFTLGVVMLAVTEKAYGNEWAKAYEKYWKKGEESSEGKPQQPTDYSKEYEKYWKKDWAKEYVSGLQRDEGDEYVDELFHQLRTKAKELNIEDIPLPDISFKLRNKTRTGFVITRVKITNQTLSGLSSLKRKGESEVVKYYGPHRISSDFKINDLEINCEVLVGEVSAINESCAIFVDIEELTGRLQLLLPENKTDPLSVYRLSFSSSRRDRPTIEIEKGCVDDGRLEKDLLRKYQQELQEELQRSARKILKEALTKIITPLERKSE